MKIQISKLTMLAILLISAVSVTAQKKTYYDYYFKKCKEKTAYYYRVVTPVGTKFLVKDYFYSNNQLQMEGHYSNKKLKDETRQGLFVFYYKNGQKSSEGEYLDGKYDGKWTRWYKDGQVKSEGTYDKNQFIGDWSFYHRNGQVKFTLNYKNGEPDGDFKSFYEDGSKYVETKYVKGALDGPYTLYFKGTGQKKIVCNYLKDSLDGKYETFFETGTLALKGEYSDNKATGTFEYFHSNGNKSCEVEYKKDKFVKATYFDQEGKKLSKKVLEEDLIKESEFTGGSDEMYKVINKWVEKADWVGVNKNGYSQFFQIRLTIDAEGNVKQIEWLSPDDDDDEFDDMYDFKKYLQVAVEDFPKFQAAKKFNRNYEDYFYITLPLNFKKK